MNTPTDDTSSPPPPRGSGLPAWFSVLARRVGFTLHRGVPRTGRVLLRSLRGLGRLVAALELTLVIKAGPELRSVIGSPVWGQYLAALAERVLTRKTYLRLAGAMALAALLDYLADGLGWSWLSGFGWLVTWVVAIPVAAVVTVLTARRFYRRSAYARARDNFGLEGWADFWDLHRDLSAHAVRHVAVTQRPLVAATLPAVPSRHHVGRVAVTAAQLRRHALIERLPVSECGTWLGRSALGPWWGVKTYVAFRDLVGLIAPPQSGKTGLMAHHVIDHPGAVISTSTKPDVYLYTAVLRGRRFGEDSIALFNPDDLGWLGSTLRWDPVRGCSNYRAATARAGLLVGARSHADNDDGRWDEWATEVLAGMLMIADLIGRTMHDVARWCHNENDPEFGAREALTLMQGLANQTVPDGVIDALAQILDSKAQKTSASVFFALRGAVGFMSDPTVAALCTPGRDEPMFDVERFLNQRGTLYLLGSEEQNAGTAPLLAAFTGHVFATAADLATKRVRSKGRLDPPLLISLDEAALITPVPLHKWVADAGGRGIHIIWSVQTPSQLRQRWGTEGADTIINATNALLIFGGLKKKSDLEEASEWTGHRHELLPDPDGPDGGGHAKFERVPVCPPDMIRRVPQWHFLLVYRMTPTTLCRMTPAWERRDVKRAGLPPGAPLPQRQTHDNQDRGRGPAAAEPTDQPPPASPLPAAALPSPRTAADRDEREGTAA